MSEVRFSYPNQETAKAARDFAAQKRAETRRVVNFVLFLSGLITALGAAYAANHPEFVELIKSKIVEGDTVPSGDYLYLGEQILEANSQLNTNPWASASPCDDVQPGDTISVNKLNHGGTERQNGDTYSVTGENYLGDSCTFQVPANIIEGFYWSDLLLPLNESVGK